MSPTEENITESRGLATTLAWAFIALSLLSLLVASSFQIWLNTQAQQQVVAGQQAVVSLTAANEVSALIEQLFETLEAVSEVGRPFSRSVAERKLVLSSLLRLQPTINGASLLNSQGQELLKLVQNVEVPPEMLATQADSNLFARVSQGERYISGVYVSNPSQEPMVTVAVPVRNSVGQIEGSLVAEVNLRFMWDLLASLKIERNGLVYVVDRDGNLIAFREPQRVLNGENLAHLEEVAQFMSAATPPKQTFDISTGLNGGSVLSTHVPLQQPDWAVVVEVPLWQAYQPIINNLFISVLVALAVAVLAGLGGVYLARYLATPLLNLTEAAAQISGGDLERQAEVAGPREVNILARTFNTMTAQLRESIARYKALADENAALYAESQATVIKLQEVDRLKTEFLTSISHELRTPLNAILGFADVLLEGIDGELPPPAKNDVKLIENSGKHLLTLINDVLDVSKIEAGMMELVSEPVPVAPLMEEVLVASTSLVSEKPLEIKADIAPDLPDIYGDKVRLKQVLFNLISNAVKFTTEGEIILKAAFSNPNTAPAMVRFAVVDTGIGIPEDKQSDVFERFKQVDMSSTRRYGGTGLGLAISKQLVEMHGGEIGVISEEGVGSEFYFTIPVSGSKN